MKHLPLLILHGAIGSKDQFLEIADKLSKDFEVHLLNFSGHGGNEINQEFSLELFTDDVIIYLNKHKIKTVNIFGYSMGGYVAINLARQYQKRVNKIFTLGTKFNWTPESAEHEIQFLDPAKIEAKIPAFAQTLKERHQPQDWKQILNSTAEFMINLGNGQALKPQMLHQLPHNVLISIGKLDSMVTLEESKVFAEAIPNGKLKILNNFKHPIEKVDQNVLIKELKSYLNYP